MIDKKRGKKKKVAKRERRERRFLPEQTYATRLSAGVGMAGALALGAGVYGQWIREAPLGYALYLVGGGAAALVGGLWLATQGVYPVRVGDAGVALERGGELTRLAWCDIDKILLEGQHLVLRGPTLSLSLPLGAHARAAARIVAEAERRLPVLLRLDAAAKAALQPAADTDTTGEELIIDAVQVAGRHCAASKTPISFERDARFCPMCSQVYHKDHVPEVCTTCEAQLGQRAFAA